MEYVNKLLKFFAERDMCVEFSWFFIWDKDLNFFVVCSDLFHRGRADHEGLNNESDLELLIKSYDDAGNEDGPYLYCARKRGMRPQDSAYAGLQKENHLLFDECGPKRETGTLV